jgi:hypothetical protein
VDLVTTAVAPPPAALPHAAHTGHILLAVAFAIVCLGGIGLVEAYQRRRREGSAPAPLPMAIAVAGCLSAGIHVAVMPSHWRQAIVYGAFFLAAAVAQLGGSLLVLQRAGDWLRANAMVNVVLLAVWLLSRTVGPVVGPARGRPEPIGPLDAASVALELVVVLASIALPRLVRHSPCRAGAPAQSRMSTVWSRLVMVR